MDSALSEGRTSLWSLKGLDLGGGGVLSLCFFVFLFVLFLSSVWVFFSFPGLESISRPLGGPQEVFFGLKRAVAPYLEP